MKIVLDTNVLVSGLLNSHGFSARVMDLVLSGVVKICYDARILQEYHEVLSRPKFKFKDSDIQSVLSFIIGAGEVVTPKILKKRLHDLADEPFLEVAIAGNVEFLITGNLKDFPKSKCEGVRVVPPREFIEIYEKLKDS